MYGSGGRYRQGNLQWLGIVCIYFTRQTFSDDNNEGVKFVDIFFQVLRVLHGALLDGRSSSVLFLSAIIFHATDRRCLDRASTKALSCVCSTMRCKEAAPCIFGGRWHLHMYIYIKLKVAEAESQ